MDSPKNIVETTLVPHGPFNAALRRIRQCLAYADSADPVCLALIGESRTGKSRALEVMLSENPPVRYPDGLRVPIVYVKVHSKPTVKSLAELMLKAIGTPQTNRRTENAMTDQIRTLLDKIQAKMVVIDEFQHFYDKGSRKVIYHVADWLKILLDGSRYALVVAGLPSCQTVVDRNEQLMGRFLAPVLMPRFDWSRDVDRVEFTAILHAFNLRLSEHFELPTLDSDEMAFRCYCATGGLIGYLAKFLRQAIWNASDAGTNLITLEALARAHQDAIWAKESLSGMPNPFDRAFVPTLNDDLLQRIRTIGVNDEPPPEPKPTRATRKPSAHETLSARGSR